jgi:hypothetical protein
LGLRLSFFDFLDEEATGSWISRFRFAAATEAEGEVALEAWLPEDSRSSSNSLADGTAHLSICACSDPSVAEGVGSDVACDV